MYPFWLKISRSSFHNLIMSARDRVDHTWDGRWVDDEDDDDDNLDWNQEYMPDDDDLDHNEDEWSPAYEFLNLLIKLLLYSSISATTFCLICYWAGRAGIKAATKYGLRPGCQTGKYSHHVKSIFRWRSRKDLFYNLIVPGQGKHDLERSEFGISIIPGYEQLIGDIDHETETELVKVRSKDDGLPEQYWDHPVVVNDPETLVYPIAIYIDGVPYSLTDGVIGFWMINLINQRRYLISILRKRNICKCGCGGWCSIYAFFRELHWELKILSEGRYPLIRDDGSPFTEHEQERQARAGTSFPIKAALLFLKGDWMEFASTFGFPNWQDGIRPCMICNMFGDRFYDLLSATLDRFCDGFQMNDDDDYFAACDRCEIKVHITMQRNILDLERILRYDRRDKGSRGRALTRDININGASLRIGDRLEPSYELPDIGKLTDLELPNVIIFWRLANEDRTRHRNPIFDRSIGVTPRRSLSVGLLHALYLGVLHTWCKTSIWKLIESGAYGHVGTQPELIAIAANVIRSNLMIFYGKYQKDHPLSNLTRVSDFVPSMIGTFGDQKLKTKAAETYGVALFLIDEIESRGRCLGDEDQLKLGQAGSHLIEMIKIWKTSSWRLDREQSQRVLDHYKIHISLMRSYDCFAPKHHIMIHPLLDSPIKGNPWNYHEFLDESLNKTLRATCRHCHQMCFDQSVLLRMHELLNDPDHHRGTKRFHT